MNPEIPISGAGEGNQVAPARDTDRTARMVGHRYLGGAIGSEHVHMYLHVPPKYAPAQVMKFLKEKSSEYLRRDLPDLSKKFWGLYIWARAYFVSTVGIEREVIKRYVREQQEEQIREDQLRLWKDSSE